MRLIEVRQCVKEDAKEVLDICYRTGYMGEDLMGKDIFNDKILFGYLFCDYYSKYEPRNCFIAMDIENGNRIVGYI